MKFRERLGNMKTITNVVIKHNERGCIKVTRLFVRLDKFKRNLFILFSKNVNVFQILYNFRISPPGQGRDNFYIQVNPFDVI